ncbi:Axin-2 [Striga asiatica]|uniref:Axin-2 n=1 Tax=Striga asiatica TaxID=4170 RepID=A0A5A7NZ65_STRAF|nr:Axin-2 [Striga asiatica]
MERYFLKQKFPKLQSGKMPRSSVGSMAFMSRYWVKQSLRWWSGWSIEERLPSIAYFAWARDEVAEEKEEEEAASMDRTAAAMSQRAERMRERRRDVKAFEASLTRLIVLSKRSIAGAGVTVVQLCKSMHEKWEPIYGYDKRPMEEFLNNKTIKIVVQLTRLLDFPFDFPLARSLNDAVLSFSLNPSISVCFDLTSLFSSSTAASYGATTSLSVAVPTPRALPPPTPRLNLSRRRPIRLSSATTAASATRILSGSHGQCAPWRLTYARFTAATASNTCPTSISSSATRGGAWGPTVGAPSASNPSSSPSAGSSSSFCSSSSAAASRSSSSSPSGRATPESGWRRQEAVTRWIRSEKLEALADIVFVLRPFLENSDFRFCCL